MNPEALPLKEIHLPPPPPWWPPAPGWWFLGGLSLILLLAAAVAWRRWSHRRRWRRRVLAELERLRRGYRPEHSAEFVAEVAALLRRVALSRYPREQVASLSGEDWLDFLDRHGGEGRFRDGPGRVLGVDLYQPRPQVDPEALTALAKAWIEKNLDGTP